jgi:DNA polymerase delta subunit 2
MILPPTPLKYMSDQDKIFIEDESGRVEIVGKVISNENMVTGTVVGILGCETATGEFEVKQICFPEMGPQAPLPEKGIAHFASIYKTLDD